MTPPAARTRFARALGVLGGAAAGWALAIWVSGGLKFHLGAVHVSATNWTRPFVIVAAAAIAALLFAGLRASLTHLAAGPRWLAAAMAVATVTVSLGGNSWTASGADSFAYASQAALWRRGHLDVPVPLAAEAPWPNAVATFAPFGYRAAPHGAPRIVPITAPGVPMIMALLQKIGGHAGAFLVTPIAGACLVLLTYGIGRRLASARVGAIAAWLVATSPAVLYILMWPMSDLPAAACAAALILLLLGASARASLGAGLAAAAGTLARPNFILIAGAAGLWLLIQAVRSPDRARWKQVAAFALGLLPGVIVVAILNFRWFGAALASGYGSAEHLLSVSRVPANAGLFVRWLAETSPLALAGLAALAWGRKLRVPSRVVSLFGLIVLSAVAIYLFYDRHEEWWYLRFLLPAWPALFVPAAIAIDAWCARGRTAAWIGSVVIVAAGVAGVVVANARGVFQVGDGERRYASVARLVDRTTEADAVILTSQHAGTVWYYSGRETVRFDVLDPAWLDRAVAWLATRGRHPYILVEDWEQPIFEARFKGSNAARDLSAPPAVAWQSTQIAGWTWLYDPLRRTNSTMQPGPEIEMNQPRCAEPKGIWK